MAWLRLLTALFFLPHIWGKLFTPQGPLSTLKAGGFPATLWFLYSLAVLEVLFVIGLTFDLYVHYVAGAAAVYLFVAAALLLRVSKGKRLWVLGGAEYAVFWGIACAIVALS